MYIIVVNQKDSIVKKIIASGMKVILLQRSENYSTETLKNTHMIISYSHMSDLNFKLIEQLDLTLSYCFAVNSQNLEDNQNIEDAAFIAKKLGLKSPCQLKHIPFFFNKHYMRKFLSLMDFSLVRSYSNVDSMKALIPAGKYVFKEIAPLIIDPNMNRNKRVINLLEEDVIDIKKEYLLEEFVQGDRFVLNISVNDCTDEINDIPLCEKNSKNINVQIFNVLSVNNSVKSITSDMLAQINHDLVNLFDKIDYNYGSLKVELVVVSQEQYEFIDFNTQLSRNLTCKINRSLLANSGKLHNSLKEKAKIIPSENNEIDKILHDFDKIASRGSERARDFNKFENLQRRTPRARV